MTSSRPKDTRATAHEQGRSDRAHADRNTALVGEVEGCLRARIHHLQAREEAEALCSRLPWATTAQAEEITRHYIEQRLTRTRHTLAHHIDELRDQYENRYQELRRDLLKRHAASACVVLAGCVDITAVVDALGH
ncbi:hypothetical protein [Streptomyces bottropensis]|uniref:hypothetical protein n=1 Tax=Streptomyces bottropensis TaxID=42235 RepID=UPI002FF26CCB